MEWVKEVGIPEAIKELLESYLYNVLNSTLHGASFHTWNIHTMAQLSSIKLDLEEA